MTERVLPDIVKSLIEEFSRSGVRELHIRRGEFELYLSNDAVAARREGGPVLRSVPARPVVSASEAPSAAGEAQATATVSAPPELPPGAVIIAAPNLGTFYRAPKPGAANYVEIGSKVAVGDELCLIEVMKLFTALRADAAGIVHAVLVEDGAMVEAGQPLFALVRD